jgi:CMP-N-acetylneuraminic acid synthetase
MSDRPLVLIPCRSNSTGVPHKNTRLDAGPSLLQRAIQIGKELGGEVWVSTRDEEAIAQAKAAGVEIEYRSRGLDQANTPMDAVVEDFVFGMPDVELKRTLVLLQPTSPQRTVQQVREAILAYRQSWPTSAVTVEEVPAHSRPDLLRFCDNEILRPLWPEAEQLKTRQRARPAYRRNGLAYVTNVYQVRTMGDLEGEHVRAVITPPTLTIDTLEDWAAWCRLQKESVTV